MRLLWYAIYDEDNEKCLLGNNDTQPGCEQAKPRYHHRWAAGRNLVFWENERHKYDFYISQYVIDECTLGDSGAAEKRLEFLKGIPVIPKSDEIAELAAIYQHLLGIPNRAKIDCFYLAACVAAEMDYLLSWNCAHLGIHTFVRIQAYNEQHGLFTPLLLTPEALMEINETEE